MAIFSAINHIIEDIGLHSRGNAVSWDVLFFTLFLQLPMIEDEVEAEIMMW